MIVRLREDLAKQVLSEIFQNGDWAMRSAVGRIPAVVENHLSPHGVSLCVDTDRGIGKELVEKGLLKI